MLVIGRLADAIDGYAADATGTKSPLGESVDAGLDKVIAFVTLAVLLSTNTVPWWIVLPIAVLNLWNMIMTWYGDLRAIHVQPSRNGKWAAFGYWASLSLFLSARLHILPNLWLLWPAYAVAVGALVLGLTAAYGYLQMAIGRIAPTAAMALFDRVVVIRNPVSTDAHKTKYRIDVLRSLLPESEFYDIETVAGGVSTNRTLLRQHQALLGPRTLLCIAAGDGTIHLILNSLLHDDELTEAAKNTPILPLWCGNANDLAYMLNGAWSPRRLRNILNRGAVVSIRPLDCTLRNVHGHEQRYLASSYASFGASAYASQELERVIHRGSPTRRFVVSRIGQEVFAVFWALAKAPTFTITTHDRTSIIFERTYLNGSRFAKVIGLPLHLTDEKFHRNTIEHKNIIALFFSVIGLMINRAVSKRAITHDAFTIHDTVWAQFDGEPIRLASGTKTIISVSKQPFYALSLRLKS
jgi:phosphatidylglycerophosphate synthase/diacylglycerol kinase family enzyme